jgi:hypothetical protein
LVSASDKERMALLMCSLLYAHFAECFLFLSFLKIYSLSTFCVWSTFIEAFSPRDYWLAHTRRGILGWLVFLGAISIPTLPLACTLYASVWSHLRVVARTRLCAHDRRYPHLESPVFIIEALTDATVLGGFEAVPEKFFDPKVAAFINHYGHNASVGDALLGHTCTIWLGRRHLEPHAPHPCDVRATWYRTQWYRCGWHACS